MRERPNDLRINASTEEWRLNFRSTVAERNFTGYVVVRIDAGFLKHTGASRKLDVVSRCDNLTK